MQKHLYARRTNVPSAKINYALKRDNLASGGTFGILTFFECTPVPAHRVPKCHRCGTISAHFKEFLEEKVRGTNRRFYDATWVGPTRSASDWPKLKT